MLTLNERQYIIPDWPAPTNIKAFCTTRTNGVSLAPFDSFNLANHVNDHSDHVKTNRQLLKDDLNLKHPIAWLQQTHTNRAIVLPHDNNNAPADAAITQAPQQVCAVLTADCLPLLICNQQGSEVAAIHAGWQGLYKNIIHHTIKKMQSPAHELLVWLGPAISANAFEVSLDWIKQFIALDKAHQNAMHTQNNQHVADLYQIARNQLKQLGITYIFGGKHCTFQENTHFFSYRRDTSTGRMASVIWMN